MLHSGQGKTYTVAYMYLFKNIKPRQLWSNIIFFYSQTKHLDL